MDREPVPPEYRFEVAFSFAGDRNRPLVCRVAELVRDIVGAGKVFFDEWYEAELAGPDAHIVLQNIYRKQTRLVVLAVGKHYGEKPWTQEEWRAIQSFERTLRDASSNNLARMRFLPLRFGDGEVDGLFDTAIVPDVRERSPEQIARLVLERLELARGSPASTDSAAPSPATEKLSDTLLSDMRASPKARFILYIARERVGSLYLQVTPEILERSDRDPLLAYREPGAVATDEQARSRAVRQLSTVLEHLEESTRIGDLATIVRERGRLDCDWYRVSSSFEAEPWDVRSSVIGLRSVIGDYTLMLQCSKNNLAAVNKEGSEYVPTSISYALFNGAKGIPLSGLIRLAAEDRGSMTLRGSALFLVLEPLNANLRPD
jgi:hypothetical protein